MQWGAPRSPCATVMALRCATRFSSWLTSVSRVVGVASRPGRLSALNAPDIPKCTCVRHALKSSLLCVEGRCQQPMPESKMHAAETNCLHAGAVRHPRSGKGRWQCRSKAGADATHVHDGLLADLGSEEVEQVFAVHFDPLQRLPGDLRGACRCQQAVKAQPTEHCVIRQALVRRSRWQALAAVCFTHGAARSTSPSAKRPFGEVATKGLRSMSFLCACATRWHWWPSTCEHRQGAHERLLQRLASQPRWPLA